MTVSEVQVETFMAALPYRDFHDAEPVRLAIAAAQRGESLSAATAALLGDHEPNWLPGVEAMVGGALHRALEVAAPTDTSSVSEAQVDVFVEAVWSPVDARRTRVLAREAIVASERWQDDGVRVAAGISLDGHEVMHMPGHEMSVAQALNEARQVSASNDARVAAEHVGGSASPEDARAQLIAVELRGLREAVDRLAQVLDRRG